MSVIVEARELSCFYGIVLGLNNVSFRIGEGITGLVGPNGAGKSTLIKLVTGQLRSSSGSLTVFGKEPWASRSALGRIGYCPEREQLPGHLRPVEWLRQLASLSGLPWRETRRASEAALDRVRLDRKHWSRGLGTFSKGMKQRAKLAQAIMFQPELLILDEPMNGLDPMGRAEFEEILKELNEQGTQILISSHILHELQFLCRSFLMLNWGRVIAAGTQLEIRQALARGADEVVFRCSDPRRLADHLQAQALLRGFRAEGDALTVWVAEPESFFADWTRRLDGSGVEIYEISQKDQSLGSLFERMTR